MNLWELPPWELVAACNVMTQALVSPAYAGTPAPASVIAPADPTRYFLLMAYCGVNTNHTTVGVDPSTIASFGMAGDKGILLTSTSGPLVLATWSHGPLVSQTWYGSTNGGSNGGNIIVIQGTTVKWPDRLNASPILSTIDPGPIRPPARIDSGPGVNGKRGILDYWYRLVSRMTGGGKV